ncbi:MAG: outer membrane protein assembly factor BamC [Pseudomonadales bacterium]|nr:outer membrane protein assembly factor BamC [Pseudomonadales bacterium]MCC6529479.1 outer membrane protein assembly factor BamC [Pseudomonadales bacterium]MCP5333545.1 outer membrane protein assembly factor BamC [Pseudomonadales bacterium]HMU91264.1 outer membrane protein assembly factor BamC [Pseudomonadales bacterium]HMW15069.1 outer membrane protein assembly factor BamC [Pseudomonadales bacterium]
MNTVAKGWVGLLLLGALTGCGTGLVRDRYYDYLDAEQGDTLKLPPRLADAKAPEPLMPIPELASAPSNPERAPVPRPRPVAMQVSSAERVTLQQAGARNWLLVLDPPAKVWPQMVRFFDESALPLKGSDPASGVLESGWLPSGGGSERFRVQVEEGVRPQSSEIKLLQQSATAAAPAVELPWPAQSSDTSREAALLERLQNHLRRSADADAGSFSLLAQNLSSKKRSELIDPGKGEAPYLLLDVGYERAWSAVELALKELPRMQVEERNHAQGVIHLHFAAGEEEKPNWFDTLIADLSGEKRAVADEGAIDQLRLIKVGGKTEIRLTNAQGTPLPKERALPLLRQIQEHLF